MAKKQRKTRTKQKQKQKQSQNVVVHIDQSRRIAPRKPQDERPKSSSIPSFPLQFMTFAPAPITQPRTQPEPFQAQAQAQQQAQPQAQAQAQAQPAPVAPRVPAPEPPVDERFQGQSQKVGESLNASTRTPFKSTPERGFPPFADFSNRRASVLTNTDAPWDDVSEMGDTLDLQAQEPTRRRRQGLVLSWPSKFELAFADETVSAEDRAKFNNWRDQLARGTRKSFSKAEQEIIKKYIA